VYVLSTAHEDIMGETLVQEEPRKRKHQLQWWTIANLKLE
jgi:hypothetical protein